MPSNDVLRSSDPARANHVIAGDDRSAFPHPALALPIRGAAGLLGIPARAAVLLGAAAVCLWGCDRPSPAAAVVLPPTEVTVSHPIREKLTDFLEYPATTTALETIKLRARVTGYLQSVDYNPRLRVKAGAVLFRIDDRPYKAALDSDKSVLDGLIPRIAKAEYDRDKTIKLYESGSASEDERMDTQSPYDALIADAEAARANIQRAQLNFDWCTVTAPIEGRVGRNLMDVGNLVTADQTELASMVDDSSVYAYFNPSEQDVLEFRAETRAANIKRGLPPDTQTETGAPVFLRLMNEDKFSYEGRIDYASPELDKSTGTLQVRGKFPNPDGIIVPGVFVTIRLPYGEPYEGLLVTERAIGSDQGQRYLLVVNDKSIVEYRPVKLGILRDGMRVITEGITSKDWVIVNGLQRVRPGVTVKPIQAEMPLGPAARAATQPAADTKASTPPASAPAKP